MEVTPSEWPESVRSNSPVSKFKILMVFSLAETRITGSSGERATAPTLSECPLKKRELNNSGFCLPNSWSFVWLQSARSKKPTVRTKCHGFKHIRCDQTRGKRDYLSARGIRYHIIMKFQFQSLRPGSRELTMREEIVPSKLSPLPIPVVDRKGKP